MAIPCHIVVEGNPAIIYASRNGAPDKVRRILKPFLGKFCQEREAAGEYHDTPECLVAQIVVRFGFEICEDDFSNLKVMMNYDPNVDYIYSVGADGMVSVWVPEENYRVNPSVGVKGCSLLQEEGWKIED